MNLRLNLSKLNFPSCTIFKLEQRSEQPRYSYREIVWKLVAENSMAIAKRHAAMPRAAEFPSTFSLARPFPTRFHTPSFHYSLLLRPPLSLSMAL